jgi:hypothetical protein
MPHDSGFRSRINNPTAGQVYRVELHFRDVALPEAAIHAKQDAGSQDRIGYRNRVARFGQISAATIEVFWPQIKDAPICAEKLQHAFAGVVIVSPGSRAELPCLRLIFLGIQKAILPFLAGLVRWFYFAAFFRLEDRPFVPDTCLRRHLLRFVRVWPRGGMVDTGDLK